MGVNRDVWGSSEHWVPLWIDLEKGRIYAGYLRQVDSQVL